MREPWPGTTLSPLQLHGQSATPGPRLINALGEASLAAHYVGGCLSRLAGISGIAAAIGPRSFHHPPLQLYMMWRVSTSLG